MTRLASYLRKHHVGLLALFIALGGGAYAASLPRNSVGPAQLRRNAVDTRKVRDKSLLARDFKAGQLPAGPKGDAGAKGDLGPKGDPGPRGPSDARATTVDSGAFPAASGISQLAKLDLPAGTYFVQANAVFSTTGTTTAETVACGVGTPGATQGPGTFGSASDNGSLTFPQNGEQQVMSLAGFLSLAAAQTVTFDCYPSGGTLGTISYRSADIGTIRLESLQRP